MAEKPDIDLSDFVALKPGSKCTVSVAIPKLSDEQREKVLAAFVRARCTRPPGSGSSHA